MNALVHRLISNPTRGCTMAVAETASSASKTPSATSKARSRSSKRSESAKSDGFALSKAPTAQWIRAQAAPVLIVSYTDATAAASTVGAIAGNITANAGNQFRQVGSDLIAPTGDINILAKKVDIIEARETSSSTTEQKFKQSGLTLSVSSPVISAIQNAQVSCPPSE